MAIGLSNIYSALFGCRHRLSRVFTLKDVNDGQPYVVCLDCGSEFPYSLAAMKVIGPAKHRQPERRDAIPELNHFKC